MSIADDLTKLEQMNARGTLSDTEFNDAKQRLLSGAPRSAEPLLQSMNGFRRSSTDRWIGGVCGGLATSTGIDSWLWRVGMVLLTFFGGVGFLAYAILWIFAPADHQTPLLPYKG